MNIIGIDPGLSGGLALLTPNGLKYLGDIPHMLRGNGSGHVKNQVDGQALKTLLQEAMRAQEIDPKEVTVIIELQQAMGGGMNSSAVFSLGMTAGIIETTVALMGLPYKLIQPKVWKAALGLTAKVKDAKGMARTMAQRMYPDAELHLAKHHNRAEALLIARYGMQELH